MSLGEIEAAEVVLDVFDLGSLADRESLVSKELVHFADDDGRRVKTTG